MKHIIKHNSLNAKQVRTLKLLYKFRFVTPALLLEYKEASSLSSLRESLKILEEQGYIGRRYKNSYRLQGKGARYYLATKGIKYLRDQHSMDKTVLHAMYKNNTVSEAYIDHNLNVFRTFLQLNAGYPDTFNTYTKHELGGLNYFPNPAPDLYLSRVHRIKSGKKDLLLDIFTDTQYFVIKKRIAQYVEHYESGDWEAETKTDYPVLLIACPNSRLEEKLQSHIEKILDSAGIDDFDVYVTTTKALLALSCSNSAIWTKISDAKTTVDLNNL